MWSYNCTIGILILFMWFCYYTNMKLCFMKHCLLKNCPSMLHIASKHKFQVSCLSLWGGCTLKMHLIYPIISTVEMCEMFPVKCKPGIKLDTVFCVWHLANVMYGRGQSTMSLFWEKRQRGEKRAVLIPWTAVLLWLHDRAVFVFSVGGGHLCVCVFICVCRSVGVLSADIVTHGRRQTRRRE